MKTNQKDAAIRQLGILLQTGMTLVEATRSIEALFPASQAKQEVRACLIQYITELDASIETLN